MIRSFGILVAATVSVAAAPAETSDDRVSFARDVWPLLKENCVSCHRPAKLKGGLDLSSMAGLTRGGDDGQVLHPGAATRSPLVAAISGENPDMPPDGEPLTAAEVDVIARWIAEGAVDDTPAEGLGTRRPAAPPIYRALPAVPAIAISPDGTLLAAAAHHEVVVHRLADGVLVGRWLGDSPRLESLAFSNDGRFLAASGGAPSEFGEIQVWDVASGLMVRSIRAGTDSLYGVSWSNDGSRLAVGGADKLVRAIDSATGQPVMQCDNHIDWVFGTAFVHDGSKLVSVSRDHGVKLIDVATGHLIDDAARPREPVFAVARHPREDMVAFAGAEGRVRLHRMAPRGGRLKEGDDKEESAVREFESMGTPLHAVAFNADGSRLACGGQNGEVRLFATENGKREATIPSNGSPVFTLAFHPIENWLAIAGGDGHIRCHDPTDGKLIRSLAAVPVDPPEPIPMGTSNPVGGEADGDP